MISYAKRTVSAALAAALSASVLLTMPLGSFAADEDSQPAQATISFVYEEEGVTIKPDEEGNVPELNDLTGKVGDSVHIPNVKLVKEGYKFSGWTIDGIRGFSAGEVIQFFDVQNELKPVWYEAEPETKYKASYIMDAEDVDYDPKQLPDFTKAAPGAFVTVSLVSFPRDGYKHLGWKVGDYEFRGEQHYIMPDHDVSFTPNWKKIYDINYDPGTDDRIVGGTSYTYPGTEESHFSLQASDRFSRLGFDFAGWLCSDDNVVYPQLAQFTMPSHDLTFTAQWAPINYNILFDEGSSSFKVRCATDDILTIPENRSKRSGYTFSGWKYEDKLYQPGDEYKVEGALPGLGYCFEAVWTSDAKFPKLSGDANGDNEVNLADAVRIMQAVSNPDKYSLNEQAEKNADVDGLSGVTYRDALYIQRYKLGIYASLSGDEPKA